MKAKVFVDSLFEGYDDTAALADFKEELLGNLNAKIESFVKKGMDAETAFTKASAELGDVSALADELSQKKRTEVFEEVYMDIRKYMNPRRVACYVIFGVLALFGATAGAITFFATIGTGLDLSTSMTSFFAVIMPFTVSAIAGFTYLGLTQETSSLYPVSNKRAAWYTVAVTLISFGLFTMPLVYFGVKTGNELGVFVGADSFLDEAHAIVAIIAMMIPFVLPGIGLLVFLGLTEKDRQKPWAKNLHNKAVKEEMEMWNDPVMASRFGMFSGAIWIFAFGFFILFGFLIGFKFSWLVFIFATAVQLLVQALMIKNTKTEVKSQS